MTKANRFLSALAVAVGGLALGCRPADEIKSYPVPKETLVRPVGTDVDARPIDRMLAAILPEGDRAWFVKVTGPIAEIDSLAREIDGFFASIRPAGAKPLPEWILPEKWQLQPASGMRAATILLPSTGNPLELTVTVLPWNGAPGEILSNVNRWRGQMQLPEIGQDQLAECTREIKSGDATTTIVDLRGRMSANGMMPPFAGAGASAPPGASASPRSDGTARALPEGHPPITAKASTATAAGAAPFTFDTPAGWQPLPASGMRKAAFQIGEGTKSALVTVFDFRADAGPMMSDPVANVNRWRAEVGLVPLEPDAVKNSLQPIEMDGLRAELVDAVPNASQPEQSKSDRGTLASMLKRGDVLWFFKLTGNRDTVAEQRANFESFLKSVRFSAPAGGASDGN